MFCDEYLKFQETIDNAEQEFYGYVISEFPNLSEDDVSILVSDHGYEIKDINAVFDNMDDAAESEARSLGYLTDDNERYFDLGRFKEDLKEDENYIELPSGAVVYIVR